jgi:hypothetical protein
MHGVERANGLDRERAADSRKNRISDTDDVATTGEHLKATDRGAFVYLTQPPGGAPPEDGAGGVGESQRGRHSLTRLAYRRPGCRITFT